MTTIRLVHFPKGSTYGYTKTLCDDKVEKLKASKYPQTNAKYVTSRLETVNCMSCLKILLGLTMTKVDQIESRIAQIKGE